MRPPVALRAAGLLRATARPALSSLATPRSALSYPRPTGLPRRDEIRRGVLAGLHVHVIGPGQRGAAVGVPGR
jgi:hypothetical protein